MTHNILRILLVILLFLTLGTRLAASEQSVPVEYQVKAAFVNNFIKFIDWPEAVFPDNKTPLIINVVGETPLLEALKTLEDTKVKGHPLSIRSAKGLQDLDVSHIAFVSFSEKHRVNEILYSLGGRNILTVGETEGFCEAGGIINFTRVNDKIHFEINIEAAQKAGLTISSKLLRLATIVRTRGGD